MAFLLTFDIIIDSKLGHAWYSKSLLGSVSQAVDANAESKLKPIIFDWLNDNYDRSPYRYRDDSIARCKTINKCQVHIVEPELDKAVENAVKKGFSFMNKNELPPKA